MERFERGYGFRPKRAAMVHHVLPLDVRPDLALDLDNLRSLCVVCHNQSHPEKGENPPLQPKGDGVRMRVIKI
jgi:5-methylcytosine-specific restriction endonuclease McrA